MAGQGQPPSRQQLRDQLVEELVKFLREKNKPETKRWSFLDRPIILTLLGSVFLSLVTSCWQTSEQHASLHLQHERSLTDQKLSLLRAFPIVYQGAGNTFNSYLKHILWRGLEKNKPKKQRDTASIEKFSAEIQRLQAELYKTEPIDGVLSQIESLFLSSEVRSTANEMRLKWSEFEKLGGEIIAAYNISESLTATEFQQFETELNELIRKIEDLKDTLIRQMGHELSIARTN
jgi:hypothetical protein